MTGKSLFAGIAASLLAVVMGSMASAATISGTLVMSNGKAMILNQATVQLAVWENSSQSDERLVSQSVMCAESQVPLPFSIEYDPASLKDDKAYEVTATISAMNGRLRWIGSVPLPQKGTSTSNVTVPLVEVDPTAETAEVLTYVFDGFRILARFGDDSVTLYMPEGTKTLPLAVSASGARFSDGETTFWTKRKEVYLETSGHLVE
ncbi:MAG: hypothetical protein CSA35_06465 [Dethiosulfovibrio peptidovorans]|nr:MAG: hypothetical protein CSA35_06465 [Dethiosulfovibrio peptidovorans]